MEITRTSDVEAERLTGSVFETQVHRKPGTSEEFGDYGMTVSEIFFAPGERTTMHEHTIRQVLYVTGGEGVVATADERHEVATGDVISIPPDEPHWHGAKPTTTFEHVSIVVLDEDGEGTFSVEEPAERRTG